MMNVENTCRDKFETHVNKRMNFVGYFIKFGTWFNRRDNRYITTAMLKDVRCESDDDILCDHVWLQYAATLRDTMPKEGDRVIFSARVKPYKKQLGRVTAEGLKFVTDYCLELPENVRYPDRQSASPTPPPESKPEDEGMMSRKKAIHRALKMGVDDTNEIVTYVQMATGKNISPVCVDRYRRTFCRTMKGEPRPGMEPAGVAKDVATLRDLVSRYGATEIRSLIDMLRE